jgi:ketopantoate reductase
MNTTSLTVAVLGPGGVGGLIGALLARDGHRVICLAGEPTAAALRQGACVSKAPSTVTSPQRSRRTPGCARRWTPSS